MTTPLCRLLPALVVWCAAATGALSMDEAMTCATGPRHGRQYRFHPELPCDLSKDGFCTDPGNQYPWGSMRRFVYENQGLMKRMYGNRRHYNVLRTELINEMYDDMYDEMPKRQHHKYRPPAPQHPSQVSPTYRSQNPRSQRTNGNKERDPRWMKTPDHERPRTRVKINKTGDSWEGEGAPGTTFSEGPEPTLVPPGYRDVGEEEGEEEVWATTISDPTTDSSSSSYSTPLSEDETDSTYASLAETTQAPATVRSDVSVGGEDESEDDYMSDSFISTPLDEDDLTTLTFRDRMDQVTKNDFEKQSYDKDEIDLGIEKAMSEEQGVVEMEGIKGEPERERGDEMSFDDKISVIVDDEVIIEADLKPENREQVGEGLEIGGPSHNARPTPHNQQQPNPQQLNQQKPNSQQLNQQQLNPQQLNQQQQNQQQAEAVGVRRPIRGVNACPVKEEFVAPYWANNTRGETLALLNLYPFEQYVQWERCTNENRQMFCRKGCRCEQQYRLHKLLAFDPSNECRGIFSDWFRFPSCCVCKCYDLPQDIFTASARRPRLHVDEYDDYSDEESDMFGDEEELEDEELMIYEIEEEEEEEEVYEEEDEESVQNEATPRVSVKIPPQRRPRLPPRPQSHIIPPSHNLLPPPLPPAPPSPPSSSNYEERERGSTEPPEVSTLGTVDVATPHYYYNVSNLARVLYANAGMHTLSRAPRNLPEE